MEWILGSGCLVLAALLVLAVRACAIYVPEIEKLHRHLSGTKDILEYEQAEHARETDKLKRERDSLEDQLGRVASLVDFDGCINPLNFTSRASMYRIADYGGAFDPRDRSPVYCELRMDPARYTMAVDNYDFSKIPEAIPHIAHRMAEAMTREVRKQLTAQVEAALKAGPRRP